MEDAEELEAELSEAKDRIKELEAEPEDPKSLSEDSADWKVNEPIVDYDASRQTF